MNAVNIAFKDFLFILVFILMMLINPPKKTSNTEEIKTPGNMTMTIVWDQGNYDVDLWMLGPAEEKAIGFRHKNGVYIDLLRDDTGNNDNLNFNYENAFSRGLNEGEYVINAHCFRCTKPVKINIEVKAFRNGTPSIIFEGNLELNFDKEEKTAVVFKLDKKGYLITRSVHHVFTPIVTRRD